MKVDQEQFEAVIKIKGIVKRGLVRRRAVISECRIPAVIARLPAVPANSFSRLASD
jgi:hypothetical protein